MCVFIANGINDKLNRRLSLLNFSDFASNEHVFFYLMFSIPASVTPTASDDEWEDEIETEATPAVQSNPESRYHHQISESEFTCACCYELMVEPTTLTCGHNFCRGCVARWFLQAKKFQCPECRQPWSGNPQVNYTLR